MILGRVLRVRPLGWRLGPVDRVQCRVARAAKRVERQSSRFDAATIPRCRIKPDSDQLLIVALMRRQPRQRGFERQVFDLCTEVFQILNGFNA